MSTLFVENLCAIDSSLLDERYGLSGMSWQVSITLEGTLDKQSMVLDFAKVKKIIKSGIDNSVDHTLLVPINDPNINITQHGHFYELAFTSAHHGDITLICPPSAVSLIQTQRICEQSLVKHLTQLLLPILPKNIHKLTISLAPENIIGAHYCYSHGLKKHDGNCQRIAHGHRSKIEIYLDHKRANDIEEKIAQHWQHKYLVSQTDIIDQSNSLIHTAYTTEQGRFDLTLPKDAVHILPSDTTVECIAAHLLHLLTNTDFFGQSYAQQHVRVKAFEGIGKGAIASTTG